MGEPFAAAALTSGGGWNPDHRAGRRSPVRRSIRASWSETPDGRRLHPARELALADASETGSEQHSAEADRKGACPRGRIRGCSAPGCKCEPS